MLLHATTCYYMLLQVASGSYRLIKVTSDCYRFLQVTTGYYSLLQVTTYYYRLKQLTTCYYRLLKVTPSNKKINSFLQVFFNHLPGLLLWRIPCFRRSWIGVFFLNFGTSTKLKFILMMKSNQLALKKIEIYNITFFSAIISWNFYEFVLVLWISVWTVKS